MLIFTCPVCGKDLIRADRSLRCSAGHSYDLAKQNYVNLLMRNQSSSKRHGDDKLMVAARQEFLDAGWYIPLRDALCEAAVKYSDDCTDLMDVGCGEGYYTSAIRHALESAGKTCSAGGIDISKTALIAAARRDPDLQLAAASVNRLPLADGGCNLLMNVFAPNDDREFRRVLRPGGILLKAVPRERHLFGLKAAVYEKPYLNPPAEYTPEGFSPIGRMDIDAVACVRPQRQIANLFMMTPYYYKTGAQDQAKLLALDYLDTELEFAVFILRRA